MPQPGPEPEPRPRRAVSPSSATARTLRAGCKINLYLRITGVLPNGYHGLDSFFLPLDEPHDDLEIRETKTPGLVFSSSLPELDPGRNTVTGAYDAYAQATGYAPGLRLFLRKGIPHGAGLGGGSADAAALLLELERMRRLAGQKPLPGKALLDLAASVGADVPFFLGNVPARVSGMGDIVEPAANPVRGLFLVLAVPDIRVATSWAFRAWDEKYVSGQESALTISARDDKKPIVHGICLQNDLEPLVFETFPELAALRNAFLDAGALTALMSGSGSGIFGIFTERQTAVAAMARLKRQTLRIFLHAL